MKRICGIIGGGAILGGLAGGALATAIGPHVPLPWLIAVGSGVLALSLSDAGVGPAGLRAQLKIQYRCARSLPGHCCA